MRDEYPAGEPRHPGGEYPADGPPPPPPPPPPPGDGYQEWPHEAPPGTGPRYKDPEAVSRGVRAAALIFAVTVLIHLLTLFGVWVSGNNVNGGYFFPEGLFVAVGGFIAAIVVTFKLPLDSRAPFWIAGVAFMALSFIIWGMTCGLALSIPTAT
jgi:hypothetical protein